MNTEKNKLKVNVHLKFNTKMYTYKKQAREEKQKPEMQKNIQQIIKIRPRYDHIKIILDMN